VEAIALGVVGPARDDRLDDPRNQGRVHLAVAVELDDDVRAKFGGLPISGQRRAAHAQIGLVDDDLNAGVLAAFPDVSSGAFGAGIVDHEDDADLRPDSPQNVKDVVPLPITRDNHGDNRRFDVRSGGRHVERSGGEGADVRRRRR